MKINIGSYFGYIYLYNKKFIYKLLNLYILYSNLLDLIKRKYIIEFY